MNFLTTKNLLYLFFVIIAAAMAFTFYLFAIEKDFYVSASVPCDPSTESCYYWVCEPDYWFDCTGDPEEDIFIYKIVRKKAYDLASCDPVLEQEGFFSELLEEEECPAPVCEDGEDCEVIYCDASDPEEAEECYSDDLHDKLVEEISRYKVEEIVEEEE